MSKYGAEAIAFGQGMFVSSSTQKHHLGSKLVLGERVFRYAQAGASDLVAGNLLQAAAPVANHLANTPPAVSAGALSFTYTPGATAGAANLYAEGYLQVDTTPGNGYTYKVAGHDAITSSTAFTLFLDDPIQVALTTSSRVGLLANKYKNVIAAPTTQTSVTVGVAVYIITAGQYGWIQTAGPCSVLINGTPAVNAGVVPSATTAGAVDVQAVAAEGTMRPVGFMMQTGVSTKNNFVDLRIES